MRFFLFILFLWLVPNPCFSSPPVIWQDRIENVYYEYTGAFDMHQELAKANILLELTHRLCEEIVFNHPVLIQIDRYNDYPDSFPAYVRVDSFLWLENMQVHNYGLIIQINTYNLNVPNSFRLISNAILNYKSIPKTHSTTDRYWIPATEIISSTLPNTIIKKYMQILPEESLSPLSRPININLIKDENPEHDYSCPISFYYQNQQYHYYLSRDDTTTRINTKIPDSLILTTSSNLFEIVNGKYHYLIFTRVDELYILSKYETKMYGPYKIDGVYPHRYFLQHYYEEIDAFAFPAHYFILPGLDTNQKVMIIPKYDLVIPNYQEKELYIIHQALKAKEGDSTDRSKPFNWTLPILLLSILLAGLILSLTLKKRQPGS